VWCFESCLIVICVFEKAVMLGVFFSNYVIIFIIVLCPNVGAFSIWYNFRNQWWIWRQHKSLQQRCESGDQCKLSSFLVTSAETLCFPATKLHYLLWNWTFNISFRSNHYNIIPAGCWNNDGFCYLMQHVSLLHHHLMLSFWCCDARLMLLKIIHFITAFCIFMKKSRDDFCSVFENNIASFKKSCSYILHSTFCNKNYEHFFSILY